MDFDTNKGPEDNRSCTDIFFCLLFVIFLGANVVVAALGFSEGDPIKLLTPFDEDGKSCGVNATLNYEYLYLYKAIDNAQTLNTSELLSNSICVKNCPVNYTGTLECYPTKNNPNCNVDFLNFFTSQPCK